MRTLLKAMLPDRVLLALRALKHGQRAFPESGDTNGWLLGMTGTMEQSFYTECAKNLRDAPGAIVDLGSWMGSTCMSMARGLGEAGGSANNMIYAFDRFIWEDWMNFVASRVACDYAAGDSFLPEVRRRTQPFRDRITLIQADLTRYTWDRGEIKLLLVDAMKSAELATAIARSFFPSLRPGAILIHQDFKHFYTPWIHVLQYRLRSHCRVLRNVPEGGTVAFTVSEPISQAAADRASDFEVIEDGEADSAFEYSLELIGNEGRASVAAAHIMHFVHRQQSDKAAARAARYANENFPPESEFGRALERLKALQVRS